MAEHVLSILVKAIGAGTAAKQIKGVDSAITGLSSRAKTGLSAAVGNVAKIGAVGVGLLGTAVTTGVQDLATLEDATTSVDGAIKQLGLTGKITSGQVASWANDIEANVQAAFDDKDIVRATTTLIRFGKVTPSNLKPAMTVMTDLAAKTGDVDSAATLLAKALADPAKAAGRLSRAGLVLTKSQQDEIKALVKAGKTAQAQKVLLDALATATKGAAAASAGPYRDALNELKDASEDARKALAIGFLPIIEKVADWLHKKLADPATIEQIKGFGQTLANSFDKLLGIVGKIPWDAVASAMKIAGIASKAILDAFVSMPDWVQTAVITGWGLNKLTGGALGGIVGELGKGLIKGVLGMNAAVVNINAGVVNGGGGGVPAIAEGAAGAGATGVAIAFASAVAGSAAFWAAVKVITDVTPKTAQNSVIPGVNHIVSGSPGRGVTLVQDKPAIGAIHSLNASITTSDGRINDRLTDLKTATSMGDAGLRERIESNRIAVQTAGQRTEASLQSVRMATNAAGAMAARATTAQGADTRSEIAGVRSAINAKDLSVRLSTVIQTFLKATISNRENSTVQTTFKKAYSTAS